MDRVNEPRSAGRSIVLWGVRIVLSGLFLYAGWVKTRDPQAFAEGIASFHLLPGIFISPTALTLPPLEMIAAILALTPGKPGRAGAFCLFALLVIFIVALGSAAASGLTVDCGCFGADRFDFLFSTKNVAVAIVRDLVLAVLAGVLLVHQRRSSTSAAADSP